MKFSRWETMHVTHLRSFTIEVNENLAILLGYRTMRYGRRFREA
jgi:hypothetical protein